MAALFVAVAGLAACSAAPPPSLEGTFRLASFFDGRSKSTGEIDTLLILSETFTADFDGRAEDGRLRLDETFLLKVGERLQRWDLRETGEGRYEGTVRTADKDGRLSAAVPVAGYRTADGAVLDYDGYAPGGGSMLLHFRHWMTAQADGTVLNRVRVSKFGIPLAGARVVFSKAEKPSS